MPTAWRIVKRRYASTAFDGEGARTYGGRWNTPGRTVVYLSESRALAALEVLAELGSASLLASYVLVGVELDERIVRSVLTSELPDGWSARPPTPATQAVGDRWLERGTSAVLRVPSVLVPAESNYLLNPAHRDSPSVRILEPEPFGFDPRLAG